MNNPQLTLSPKIQEAISAMVDAIAGEAPAPFMVGIGSAKRIELRYNVENTLRRLALLAMRDGARQVMGITPEAVQLPVDGS